MASCALSPATGAILLVILYVEKRYFTTTTWWCIYYLFRLEFNTITL